MYAIVFLFPIGSDMESIYELMKLHETVFLAFKSYSIPEWKSIAVIGFTATDSGFVADRLEPLYGSL